MKTSKITFYKVGLNDSNWAYDSAAFTRILNAGRLGSEETLAQPLAFGQPFNISVFEYETYKTATYLKIVNTTTRQNGDAVTVTRYGFINNMLEMANGNYAVSYSLDDWANFILSGEYTPEIDAMTERASIPLYKGGKLDLSLAGGSTYKINGLKKEVIKYGLGSIPTPVAPRGTFTGLYKCKLIFFEKQYFNGVESESVFSGSYTCADVDLGSGETVGRFNSSIAFLIFSNSANGAVAEMKIGERTIIPGRAFKESAINNKGIAKIIDLPYIPEQYGFTYDITTGTVTLNESLYPETDHAWADVVELKQTDGSIKYYKAPRIIDFAPYVRAEVSDAVKGIQNEPMPKPTEYAPLNSFYKYTSAYRKITFKYLSAEIEIAAEALKIGSEIYAGLSAVGDSVYLKFKYLSDKLKAIDDDAATASNTGLTNLYAYKDYKSYKNALITGSAQLSAGGIGTVGGIIGGVASGNYAGAIQTAIAGAGNVVATVRNLELLNPKKVNSAAIDSSMASVLEQNMLKVVIETPPEPQATALLTELDRVGIDITMDLNTYLTDCRLEAFNAIKCSYCEIHGLNQQAARRIADAFVAGVTLWTSSDVGNKRQVNIERYSNV